MDFVHGIPFEVTDLQSHEVIGTPTVSVKGGLEWSDETALPTGDGDTDADQFSWCLSVDDYPVPELLRNVEAPYLQMLFGEKVRDDAISAQEFLRGITLCTMGCQVDGNGT